MMESEDESPHSSETEHAENPNTSLDDGGPLEVLALSVKDDNEEEEKEVEDINNDDDEMPPKITMEDLADDLDSSEENGNAHGTDSPQMKFEELTPRVEAVPDENAATEAMDTGNVRHESTSDEYPKLPQESGMQVEDVGSKFSQEPKSYDHRNEHPGLRKDIPSGHSIAPSHRNWQTRNYSTTEGFHKSSHLNELDEDVVMMRAKAALRRANRLSPTQGVSSYSYDPHSLTLSDLSLNVSSTWEPVRMSTPLAPHLSTPGNYRSHRDHDSPYGYKSTSRSHRHDSAGVTYSEESGFGRSGGDMASHYSHGVSGKRLSPAVEDIIRRRKFQGGFEGRYPLSTSWKKSSSPLFSSKYDSKWQLSHTYPMSYVEWKALYWRPPRDHFTWRDRQYQTNQYGYESDFKRSPWPPRPVSSKLIYGSRPLSPPVTFPPAKVPRAVPGGFVSKIALPSYQDNSDSGYSDWQRGGSQWENTVRSQHSLMGCAGEFQYY